MSGNLEYNCGCDGLLLVKGRFRADATWPRDAVLRHPSLLSCQVSFQFFFVLRVVLPGQYLLREVDSPSLFKFTRRHSEIHLPAEPVLVFAIPKHGRHGGGQIHVDYSGMERTFPGRS